MRNYKLDFVKIDCDNLVSGVGTAGNIWIVLNALLNIGESDRLHVDMTVEPTVNTEIEPIFGSKNPWEYYFTQVPKPELFQTIDSVNIPSRISYYKRYSHSSKIGKKLCKSFFDRFGLRPEILNEVDAFFKSELSGKHTLGVQIRLTDMAHGHNVKQLSEYITKISKIIKSDGRIQQVFLATDDFEVIQSLKESISLPVVFLPDIYRACKDKPDNNPYDRCEYIRPDHRYKLGKEVIMDIILLSRCNQILKADVSCVSQIAVFFSQHIERTHFLDSFAVHYGKKLFNRIANLLGERHA